MRSCRENSMVIFFDQRSKKHDWSIRIPYGYLMDTLWVPYGYLMDTLWIPDAGTFYRVFFLDFVYVRLYF